MKEEDKNKVEVYNLKDMTKGWFVGNFSPSLFSTSDFEIAVKEYKAGDYESKHYHKLADELTVIASGEVLMNGIQYKKDDIIKIKKNQTTDFKALTDVITVVVKIPCCKDDKYEAD